MITIPSPLADAMVDAAKAYDAWHAAEQTGNRELIRRKRDEWLQAAEKRRRLTPPPPRD